MTEAVAWCPACGESLQHRYPFCMHGAKPTPLYLSINALAHYIVGVPTHVEFAIWNAGDHPVALEAFTARIGGATLQPGVLPEPEDAVLQPAQEQPVVLDRVVDVGIDKVMPGQYALELEVRFAYDGQPHVLKAHVPVQFQHAGQVTLPAFVPWDESIGVFDGNNLPPGEPLMLTKYGEQDACIAAVAEINRLKRTHGGRFLPVRAMNDSSAAAHASERWYCPACGARLIEGGAFCHSCGGRPLQRPHFHIASGSDAAAFCMCCDHPRGALRGLHRFCPYTGSTIPFHLQLATVDALMEDVQARLPVQFIKTTPELIRLNSLTMSFGHGDRVVTCEAEELEGGPLTVVDDCVPLTFFLRPENGAGERRLRFSVAYTEGDVVREYCGVSSVWVVPGNADRQTFVNHFGPEAVHAAESVVSGGSWNINFQALSQDKREQFVQAMMQAQHHEFHPVRLRFLKESLLEVEPDLPAPPKCSPVTRASLSFVHGGVPHNYCLYTCYSTERGAYGPVRLGRDPGGDARLVDVEGYQRRKAALSKGLIPAGLSASRVSRVQWEVSPSNDGHARTLTVKHLSSSNRGVLTGGRTLGCSESAELPLGAGVSLAPADAPKEKVIGLRHGASSEVFPELTEARELAARILGGKTNRPLWHGQIGGYCLRRVHSLTGEAVEGAEDLRSLEAYVLVPGWASIGSSPDACIRVPEPGVRPIHAWLLHVDGYFFVYTNGDAEVSVAEQAVPSGVPWPLDANGTDLKLSGTELRFGPFRQLWL